MATVTSIKTPSLRHIGQSCYANCAMYILLFVENDVINESCGNQHVLQAELHRLRQGEHTSLEHLWPLLPSGHSFSLHHPDCPIEFYNYITNTFFTSDTLRLKTVTSMSTGPGSPLHKVSSVHSRTSVWNTTPATFVTYEEPVTQETLHIEYMSPQYGLCTLLHTQTTVDSIRHKYFVLGIRRCMATHTTVDNSPVYPLANLLLPHHTAEGKQSLHAYGITAVIFYKRGHYQLLYRLVHISDDVWYLFDDTKYPNIQTIPMAQGWDVFLHDKTALSQDICTGCVLVHYSAQSSNAVFERTAV